MQNIRIPLPHRTRDGQTRERESERMEYVTMAKSIVRERDISILKMKGIGCINVDDLIMQTILNRMKS
jgi:hypothetical protein